MRHSDSMSRNWSYRPRMVVPHKWMILVCNNNLIFKPANTNPSSKRIGQHNCEYGAVLLHAITLWELEKKSKPRFSHCIEYCLWMCVVAGWHVDYVTDVVVGVFLGGGLWHVSVWWLVCNVAGCHVVMVTVVDVVGEDRRVLWPVLKLE